MTALPVPPDEAARLSALNELSILGSLPNAKFDALVQTASLVCGTPISLISLVGEHKQWIKAQVGFEGIAETAREISFCAHAILGDDLFEVQDARADDRFADNPLVTGAPDICFYAGAPLILSDGHRIGTLCVIDNEPRCLDDKQRTIMRSLAKVAACALENWSIARKKAEIEQVLARKQHRLENLVEATNVGTWEWNLATGEMEVSERYAGIFGWTLNELTPFSANAAFAAMHLEDLATWRENIDAAPDGRTRSYDHEFRAWHRNGHVIWIRGQGTVVLRAQDGSPEWVFGTLEDITQRKAQEAALSKSQAFLDETGRLAGVGGWELDLATEQVAWSTETFRIHGADPGFTPTLGGALAFYAPEGRAPLEAAIARAVAGEGGWDLEAPLIQANGKRAWVRSVGSAIFADGRPVRLIGAVKDVTKEVAQRQALLAANERLVLASETAGIGIWEWDPVIGVIVWDDRMHSLYGRERTTGTLSVEEWLQTIHPDDRARAGDAARVAVEGRQPYDVAFRVVRGDGTIRHLHAMARSYGDAQGKIVRMVGVNWDITDAHVMEAERTEREHELRVLNGELERTARHLAKARDAADRASRAKSRFLAGMSHELRTPLNGILGYAQLLRLEGGLSETQAGRVDAMLDAGTHLLDMISSVLELSEIETEHVELHPIEVDLAKIAMASLDLVRPRADAKGLRLTCSADIDAPKSLVTDRMRLRQIILNLLGNAVKFTESGRVELRLRTMQAALRFEIADTGPGIRPDEHARLFQDFERLQSDVAGSVEGAGLGLALSSRLAALLGGRMGHDDNPGGGSIFWLELPLNFFAASPAAPKPPPLPAAAPAALEGAASRLRVLVVDDVAMNRDIACSFLRVANHDTVCAATGVEAVQAVLSHEIDVVLMDVQMPEVDGLEATRRIRQLSGPAGHVPIIGLTAQAFAEQVVACTQAGMDEHLAKPYTPKALCEAVLRAAALRPHRRHRQDAAAKPSASADHPVRDAASVERMMEYLTPALIDTYLNGIAERCTCVLSALGSPETPGQPNPQLADTVHTLAGSAGMLGYARLAHSGVAVERSLRSGEPAAGLVADLVAAIEVTLSEIRSRPVLERV